MQAAPVLTFLVRFLRAPLLAPRQIRSQRHFEPATLSGLARAESQASILVTSTLISQFVFCGWNTSSYNRPASGNTENPGIAP